ncbi:MAG TPA: NADH-quinone oxidoreductase subunit C [Phycicoccus sp.]|nr:NADH-quinone oxidoreductase subunit C [Phycicoccus sp.]
MSDSDEVRTVAVADWHTAVESARESGHTFFDWLTAVDQTDRAESPGFDVTIRLLHVSTPGRLHGIRLTTAVPDGASLASVTDLFRGAAWHERETHEMFGLQFGGFVDHTGDPGLGLRPLLLPEGFDGTPLRKSFQLAARASKPWPGGKEPGEGHDSVKSPSRRRVQAPGVPPPEWGPR